MVVHLTLSRSSSEVKVIGQSSCSLKENVAKMVSTTSSKGFLVFVYFYLCLHLAR